MKPGDGGKLARAAGNAATVVSHGKKTIVDYPPKLRKHLTTCAELLLVQ